MSLCEQTDNVKFIVQTVENFLQKLVSSGIDIKDISQSMSRDGDKQHLYVKHKLVCTFHFRNRIEKTNERWNYVTEVFQQDY